MARPRTTGFRPCWAAAGTALLMAGCAAPLRSVPLATDDPARPAYQLFGPHPVALDEAAARLCPAGHDVWRRSDRRSARVGFDREGWQRWTGPVLRFGFPDEAEAQMTIVCLPAPSVAASAQRGATASGGLTGNAAGPSGAGGPGRAAAEPAAARPPRGSPATAPVSGYDL